LRIEPRCADFGAQGLDGIPHGRRLVFFPGSTIGNFEPPDAVHFLQRLGRLAGPEGSLLIGVDLKKETRVLDEAYNDATGITAAFNLNVLARLNRELAADFDLEAFEHRARYRPELGRVEMHLVSRRAQQVTVAGQRIPFRTGESIHTENSYKYTIDEFRRLAAQAGWEPLAAWADPHHLFSVQYFARAWSD
jgi:dimethylhistidine N-methyltransferase